MSESHSGIHYMLERTRLNLVGYRVISSNDRSDAKLSIQFDKETKRMRTFSIPKAIINFVMQDAKYLNISMSETELLTNCIRIMYDDLELILNEFKMDCSQSLSRWRLCLKCVNTNRWFHRKSLTLNESNLIL